MPSSGKENWPTLQRIALRYFKELRQRHPDWRQDDLFAELNLAQTALFHDLANQAGFKDSSHPTPEQICAVASMCMRGIWSDQTIADELKISIQTVRAIFESCHRGFGQAPYGATPYGGNRKRSDGKEAVPRRVTTAGQLSYRGKIYTLGAVYRGRNAHVRERGAQLLVTFTDRSPIYLARRH